MVENQKRDSAPGSGERGRSGKKPRAEVVPDGVVKLEQEEGGEVSQGGEGAGAVVALEPMEEPQMNFTMGVSLFHCQACLFPLKPPTFLCPAGHVVCCGCRVKHGQACSRAATYAPCPAFDAVVADAKLPCQYEEFGCKSMVVYYQAADHHAACPWAPCFCPVPGCKAFASPARLVDHFRDQHHWPVTAVRYGRPSKIPVPAAQQGCHVLVGEADRCVFLVSPCAAGAAGAGAAVALVCVSANGGAAARFWCKLSVELPSDTDKMAMITSPVGSSDLSGGYPAADRNMFLAVPPVLLHGASGESPELSVRIDKVDAAARSGTPPARCSGRQLH
ncbi:hypothetical protein ACP70R_030355 [Stipagrostis hirtigluma subsp. patula]